MVISCLLLVFVKVKVLFGEISSEFEFADILVKNEFEKLFVKYFLHLLKIWIRLKKKRVFVQRFWETARPPLKQLLKRLLSYLGNKYLFLKRKNLKPLLKIFWKSQHFFPLGILTLSYLLSPNNHLLVTALRRLFPLHTQLTPNVWVQVVGHVLITFQRSPLRQIRKSSQHQQNRQRTTTTFTANNLLSKATKGEKQKFPHAHTQSLGFWVGHCRGFTILGQLSISSLAGA